MDQDFRVREACPQSFLGTVQTVVGLLDGPVGRNPDVELREIVRSAASGAEVVKTRQLGILLGGGKKFLAPFIGPLAIHELVERMAGVAPRSPQQPQRDEDSENRIRAPEACILVD